MNHQRRTEPLVCSSSAHGWHRWSSLPARRQTVVRNSASRDMVGPSEYYQALAISFAALAVNFKFFFNFYENLISRIIRLSGGMQWLNYHILQKSMKKPASLG